MLADNLGDDAEAFVYVLRTVAAKDGKLCLVELRAGFDILRVHERLNVARHHAEELGIEQSLEAVNVRHGLLSLFRCSEAIISQAYICGKYRSSAQPTRRTVVASGKRAGTLWAP